MRFKVRQEVTLTDYIDFSLLNCSDKGVFKIARVYEVDGETRFYLKDTKGNSVTFNDNIIYSFIEEELELYYPKVKVGDKIIFTSDKNLPFVTKGNAYIIKRIDFNYYYIENTIGFLYRHQFRLKSKFIDIEKIYNDL